MCLKPGEIYVARNVLESSDGTAAEEWTRKVLTMLKTMETTYIVILLIRESWDCPR